MIPTQAADALEECIAECGPAREQLRVGTVEEVASLVFHLASEDGAHINGASLDIDGRYSA